MKISGTIKKKDGGAIEDAQIDILLDGNTAIAHVRSNSDGIFQFSSDKQCSGRLLKFVITADGFKTLPSEPMRPDNETVKVDFILDPVAPPPSGDWLRRTKRVWTIVLVVDAILIFIGFVAKSASTGIAVFNPLLICAVTLFLTARRPLYQWTAAFWIVTAHFLTMSMLMIGKGGTKAILYFPILAMINLLFLALIERFRVNLRRIPLVGKLIRAESVNPLGWELRTK